jgi:SHS2 domain-containing protein
MGNKYKIVNGTSCLQLIAYGKNIKELFENAAFAMFTLIGKPAKDARRKPIKLTVTANNTEALLAVFLRETLYYYSVRKTLLCGFDIMSLTEHKLHAKLTGEELISRHKIIHDIKSATCDVPAIIKTRAGYKTHITFEVK